MNRSEIIAELKKYFNIHELVDKSVYDLHGESSWKFFDTEALLALLTVRKKLAKQITINTWFWGGRFSQRGLRHNQSPMVRSKSRVYLSAHMLGKAFDFDVKGMSATQVRTWIKSNPELFKSKIRLEEKLRGKEINWVHLDVIQEEKNPQIYLFDV